MAITIVHDCDAERRATPNALNGDFRDCCIAEGTGADNIHDSGLLLIGVDIPGGKGSAEQWRGLYRYDLLSFIPASATITAATWHVYVVATDVAASHSFIAWRIRRHDWKEDEATWNAYKTGSNWTTAGAEDATDDRDMLVGFAIGTGVFDSTGWKAITCTTLVQDAWTEPARNGICTFVVERFDIWMANQGLAQLHAKGPPPNDPLTTVHHLRVTYTLADRTFQVMVR